MSAIGTLMTANPASCNPQTPIRQVAQLMIDNDCGQIPVVDADNRPLGVVTDRDIAVRVVAAGKDLAQKEAEERSQGDPQEQLTDALVGELPVLRRLPADVGRTLALRTSTRIVARSPIRSSATGVTAAAST